MQYNVCQKQIIKNNLINRNRIIKAIYNITYNIIVASAKRIHNTCLCVYTLADLKSDDGSH